MAEVGSETLRETYAYLVHDVYRKWCPAKMNDVSALLEKYRNQEDEVYDTAVRKYVFEHEPERWLPYVVGMYKRFNPKQLDRLGSLLKKYKGSEGGLFKKLCDKYLSELTPSDPKLEFEDSGVIDSGVILHVQEAATVSNANGSGVEQATAKTSASPSGDGTESSCNVEQGSAGNPTTVTNAVAGSLGGAAETDEKHSSNNDVSSHSRPKGRVRRERVAQSSEINENPKITRSRSRRGGRRKRRSFDAGEGSAKIEVVLRPRRSTEAVAEKHSRRRFHSDAKRERKKNLELKSRSRGRRFSSDHEFPWEKGSRSSPPPSKSKSDPQELRSHVSPADTAHKGRRKTRLKREGKRTGKKHKVGSTELAASTKHPKRRIPGGCTASDDKSGFEPSPCSPSRSPCSPAPLRTEIGARGQPSSNQGGAPARVTSTRGSVTRDPIQPDKVLAEFVRAAPQRQGAHPVGGGSEMLRAKVTFKDAETTFNIAADMTLGELAVMYDTFLLSLGKTRSW